MQFFWLLIISLKVEHWRPDFKHELPNSMITKSLWSIKKNTSNFQNTELVEENMKDHLVEVLKTLLDLDQIRKHVLYPYL